MSEFLSYVRKETVVGLAVGFVMGGALSDFVGSIVRFVINPLLSVAFGNIDLADRVWTLVDPSLENPNGVIVRWGIVVISLINFVLIISVAYIALKWLGIIQPKKGKKSKK